MSTHECNITCDHSFESSRWAEKVLWKYLTRAKYFVTNNVEDVVSKNHILCDLPEMLRQDWVKIYLTKIWTKVVQNL